MDGLLHLVQREGAPPSPLLAVQNITAHRSTASVSTSYYSMWHYNYLCIIKVKLGICTIFIKRMKMLSGTLSPNSRGLPSLDSLILDFLDNIF